MSKLYTIPISENQRRSKEINDDTAEALAQLGSDISAESAERVNADATLNQAVITLGGTLNNAISETNSNLDNLKTEQNIQLATEKNERREADSILDDKIATESARAKQAETAVDTRLTQQIEAEANARALADNIHAQETKALIEAEQSSRKSEDDALRTAIAKEVSDRASEINSVKQTIQSNVNNLAPKNNPTFTGTPVVPAVTDAVPDNQIANVKYVKDKVAAVDAKIVVFQKATATTNGKEGLVPAQGKTSKKQVLTSDGWNDLDAAGMTLILPSQNGTLTYNQNSQTPAWNNYDPQKMTLEVTAQTNAGTYKAKFTPKGLYVWADTQLQTAREVEWTINPMLLPKPSANNTTFTFNNQAQSLTIANYNSTFENQTGTISATNAGNYTATYSLKNTNNTKWSDGTTANVNIAWVINILYLDKPVSSGTVEFDYDKTVHTLQVLNYNSTYMTQGGTVSTAEAGEYNATYTLKNANNARWKDNSTGVISLPWKIVVRELAKPTLPVDTFTFSYSNNNGAGTMHTINPANYETRFMKMTGTTSASDAGVYEVTFTLLDEKYSWEDKTKTPIKRQWTINRAKVVDPVLIANSATYSGANIFIQMKDYGQNWLNGKPAGTSKATWTTSLPTGMSSSGESAYVLNAGSYTFNLTPNKNHCWQDGTFAAKSYTFTVNKQAVTIPSITTGRDYNGQVYTITWTNFNATLMTKSGTESATNAGTYYVTATLKDTNNYMWSDSTTEPKRFSFTINRAKLSKEQSNLYQKEPFTYSNSNYTFTPENYSATFHKLGGTLTAKDAGTYYATAIPTDNYLWDDGTATEKSIGWSIEKEGSIVIPTAGKREFLYTGSKITLQVDGINSSKVEKVAGVTEATAVGQYFVTYGLKDKANTTWANGSISDIVIIWSIDYEYIAEPQTQTTVFTFEENTSRSPIFTSAFDSSHINLSGDTSKVNVGQYSITCSLKNKTTMRWLTSGDNADIVFTWRIDRKKITALLSTMKQSGTLTFNAAEQTVAITNFNSQYHVLSGTTKATAKGTYYAMVSLTANYAWSDGSTSDKSVQWSIQSLTLAKPTLTSANYFIFDNTQKSLVFSGVNSTFMEIIGTVSAVNESSNTAYVKLKYPASSTWTDGKNNDLSFAWTIERTKLNKPTLATTSFTTSLDGTTSFTPALNNFNSDTMTASGTLTATAAGTFTITVALKDKARYKWSDNSDGNISLQYTVNKGKLRPMFSGLLYNAELNRTFTGAAWEVTSAGIYDEKAKDRFYRSVTNTADFYIKSVTGTFSATNVGRYSLTITLSNNFVWQDGSTGAKTMYYNIKPKPITAPTVSEENRLIFNGTTSNNGIAQNVQLVGFDSDTMTLGGTTSAVDAGTYTCTVTPKSNWCWDDGTQKAISLQWRIYNKPLTATQSNLYFPSNYLFCGTEQSFIINGSNLTFHTLSSQRPASANSTARIAFSAILRYSIDVYTCKNFCFDDETTKKTLTIPWKTQLVNKLGNRMRLEGIPSQRTPFFDYTGDIRTVSVNVSPENSSTVTYDPSSVFSASTQGVYKVILRANTSYKNSDNSVFDVTQDAKYMWNLPTPFDDTKFFIYKNGDHNICHLYWGIGVPVLLRPCATAKQRAKPFTGSLTMFVPDFLNKNYMTITGNTATEPGTYTAIVKLNDGCYWESGANDGTVDSNRDDMTFEWSIGATNGSCGEPPEITSDTEFTYDGSAKSITVSSFDGSQIVQGGYLSATNAGTYTITFKPATGYTWDDGTVKRFSYTWKINPKPLPEALSTFTQKGTLTYNNKAQTVTINGYNATYHVLGGTTSATNAGTYTATITCKANYCFSDGTTAKNVSWEIGKFTFGKPSLSASTYTYTGSNPVVVNDNNTDLFTVTYKKGTAVVTSPVDAGSYSITIALKDKTNYKWSDGTTNDAVYNFTITPLKLTKPSAIVSTFTYSDGLFSLLPYFENYNSTYMTVSGDTRILNGGTYTSTFTLKNTTNTTWADGSTAAVNLQFTIEPQKLSINPSTIKCDDSAAVYDGKEHTPHIFAGAITLLRTDCTITEDYVGKLNFEPYYIKGTSPTKAGTYPISIFPYRYPMFDYDYCWPDGTTDPVSFTWTLHKAQLALPYLSGTVLFEYDGKEHTPTVVNTNTNITLSGTQKATAVGTYTITAKINDTKNYEWENGTTADISLSWTIGVSGFIKPTIAGNPTYSGSAQSPSLNNFNSTFMETSSQTSATEAGTYTIVVKLKDKAQTKWADGTTADISLKWSINRKSTGVATNTTLAYTAMTYNGSEQTLSSTSHRVDYFTYVGTVKSTKPGTFTVNITPKSNYCWSDGSVKTVQHTWTISKASRNLKVAKTLIVIDDSNVATFCRGDLDIFPQTAWGATFDGNDDLYFDAVKASQAWGSFIYGVEEPHNLILKETDNYVKEQITIKVKFIATIKGMTWSQIKRAIRRSSLLGSFIVGDSKTISGNVKATLIGVDHNKDLEGEKYAHFAVFNAGLSLAHHTTDTNSGGWKDSDIRKYLNDTYLKSLPSDLQSAIIAINKYTDNGVRTTIEISGYKASDVSVTSDKIWIFAKDEVSTASISYIYNTAEANYTEQYEYFKNGNLGITGKMPLRSPMRTTNNFGVSFGMAMMDNNRLSIMGMSAKAAGAVVPCFAIG